MLILLGLAAALCSTFLLTRTALHRFPSLFLLVLPPIRMPLLKRVIPTAFDRTCLLLGRAASMAVLAGQGDTDCYNLGYVQNVVKGQILAELVPLAEVEEPLPRFILKEAVLPQGANTRIDPAHPQYLLADANGYVFYYQDKIVVKRLLNVRTDVSFQTGNIFFVGDTVVHKDVKAGFSVQANNVLVHGIVEGGEVPPISMPSMIRSPATYIEE